MFKSAEMMRQELELAGLPKNINVECNIADTDLKKRYLAVSDMMVDGIAQVVLVWGLQSPTKDLICAKLMRRYMFKKERTGRWLTSARISAEAGVYPKGAGVICISGIDKLLLSKAANLSDILREWIPEGRVFIISAPDEVMLLSIFGRDLLSYIKHIAVELNVKLEPPSPISVETGEGRV